MKRDVYSKLMKLQSPEADRLLINKFTLVASKIRSAKNNDEILDQLDILEQLIFKVADKSLNLLDYLLKRKPLKLTRYKSPYGEVDGRSHGQVISKCLDLINQLRYYSPGQDLDIYYRFHRSGKNELIKDKLRDLAEFNLDAMQHVGYGVQGTIIEKLKKLEPRDDSYVDFELQVLDHMASPEGHASGMTSENTLSLRFAPLPVNKQLEDIRRWIIVEASRLIKSNSLSIKLRLQATDLLFSMMQGPHRGEASKKLVALIERDTLAALETLNVFLSTKKSTSAQLPIALEVEEKLYFLRKDKTKAQFSKQIDVLLKTIHKHPYYEIYQTLVGDRLSRMTSDESYEKVLDENNKARVILVSKFGAGNKQLIRALHFIAEQADGIEDWKLNTYNYFLEEVAMSHPRLASNILGEADKANAPLVNLTGYFLTGFKKANAIPEYKAAIRIVTRRKLVQAVPQVAISLSGKLSAEDIALARALIFKSGSFKFLQKEQWPNYLHALTNRLALALESKNAEVTSLFIALLNTYDQHSTIYFSALEMAQHSDGLQINQFDASVKKVISDKLIKLARLEHRDQELLVQIFGINPEKIVEFFITRVRYAELHPMRRRSWEHDPVPYHLNPELSKLLAPALGDHSNFKQLIDSFTVKWTYYNSEISQLLRRVGNYKTAAIAYINSANNNGLKKILHFCHDIQPLDLDIAFAIIKRTDDKKIWQSVRSCLYSTGMVSGEFGLANAHQQQREQIKRKFGKNSNPRVKKFTAETLKWLHELVKQERQRTREELRLRKIDFEH